MEPPLRPRRDDLIQTTTQVQCGDEDEKRDGPRGGQRVEGVGEFEEGIHDGYAVTFAASSAAHRSMSFMATSFGSKNRGGETLMSEDL